MHCRIRPLQPPASDRRGARVRSAAGAPINRIGFDRETGRPECSHRPRHVRGRGYQQPALAGLRVGEKAGEYRVLDGVARLLFRRDPFVRDTQRYQLPDGENRLDLLIENQRVAAAAEDDTRIRISAILFNNSVSSMNPENPRQHVAVATPPPPVIAPARAPTKSYWWVWLLVLCLAGGAAYRWYPRTAEGQGAGAKGADKGGGRTVPAVATTSRKGDMPVYLPGLGSVTAFNTVTVRSRVDGQIVKIAFTEGQTVKEGDLLVEIDRGPFR